MTLLTEQPRRTLAATGAPTRRARRRVLVSAYAVSPARGSEPGMGWHLCRHLASHHDVTVLCAPSTPGWAPDTYRREIDAWMAQHGPVPGLTVHYIDHPFWSRLWQRERQLFQRTLYYSGYAAWQRAAYRIAAELHRERPFDLVHHLNISGYREPGYLWRLPAPFVWGPMSGAQNVPAAFLPLMGRLDRVFYRMRNLTNEWQKRTARRCHRAAARASHVWAVGEENRRAAMALGARRVSLMLDTGTEVRPDQRPRKRGVSRPLRLAWSGLHIGRKALPLLLHALARLAPDVPVEALVLGGGSLTVQWKLLADQLGVAGRVRWLGHRSQADALGHVADADVFVHTSVHEGTPHAVLEALSLGLPVICHDACGMGVAVNDECGIRVPMSDPETSIAGFAEAIRRLAGDPDGLERLSAGALRRAQELTWESKAREIAETYHDVLARAEAVTQ